MNEFEPDFDDEWHGEIVMNYEDVKRLYSLLCFAEEIWPGAPRRPYEEQDFIKHMKTVVFSMLADYTFHNH